MKNISVYFLSSLLLLTTLAVSAQGKPAAQDTIPLYQGINLKIDIGNSIYELATTSARNQSYEALLNVDLKHKYFPTIEAGFAKAATTLNSGAHYTGNGFFGRIGSDFNAMKKSDSNNLLLIGLRVGTAFQHFSTDGLSITDDYWQTQQAVTYSNQFRVDAWGEVTAGVQVQIVKGLHMGFYLREKILMTRGKERQLFAYYIPGFGYKKDANFGFNYYIGYHF